VPRKKPPASPQDFEQALSELEALVERLEEGELPLETALEEFERGIALTRQCQNALREAEQRVKLLTEQGEERDFQPQDEDGDQA
jgi:exodeoxyribonuclease VII small subunit